MNKPKNGQSTATTKTTTPTPIAATSAATTPQLSFRSVSHHPYTNNNSQLITTPLPMSARPHPHHISSMRASTPTSHLSGFSGLPSSAAATKPPTNSFVPHYSPLQHNNSSTTLRMASSTQLSAAETPTGSSPVSRWGRSPKTTDDLPHGASSTQSTSPIARHLAAMAATTAGLSGGEAGRTGGMAGPPLSREENPDGKKKINANGLMRVHRLLTEDEIKRGQTTRWTEMEVHGRIRTVSLQLFTQMRFLTALFMSGNLLTKLPAEIAQLCNLTILDLSHNKLRSLPAELGDMISLCQLYLDSNQIRVLPYELGKLFRLHTFSLLNNPLSPDIGKIYKEVNGEKKLLQHLLDHLAINTSPPPERQWITIRDVDPNKTIATFTVLCYNVLCDKYATVNLYSYCPQWALNWEYRKQYIIKEICHYDADIVTLQEVVGEQYRQLFQPKLEAVGYVGQFFPKSRSRTMGEEEKKYVDGCAIFWKADKFELERMELIEFSSIAVSQAAEKAQANEKMHENMINRVMPRDNIALAGVLRIKEALYSNHIQGHRLNLQPKENVVGNVLMVCTAHIHWDPEFCDVKLIQSMMLVHELHKILEKVATKYHLGVAQIPMLVCGDFNSLPESGVFEFLSKGAIARDHPDLKSFANDPCLNVLSAQPEDPRNLTHSLRLDSAVDPAYVPFTNYTLDFRGMIDYIFATPQSLARLGVLGPLDAQWVQGSNRFVGFPQPYVPSDHIPIMAQYAVVPTAFQRAPATIQHFGSQHSGGFGPIGRMG